MPFRRLFNEDVVSRNDIFRLLFACLTDHEARACRLVDSISRSIFFRHCPYLVWDPAFGGGYTPPVITREDWQRHEYWQQLCMRTAGAHPSTWSAEDHAVYDMVDEAFASGDGSNGDGASD